MAARGTRGTGGSHVVDRQTTTALERHSCDVTENTDS